MLTPAVEITGLVKAFGPIRVFNGLSLRVERGTIFGLLAPNGAGKTTLIRILTTLTRPDQGRASVEGHDIHNAGRTVRSLIGVVPQENNLDRYLTARENLVLHARLHRLSRADYEPRIDELLHWTGLTARQHDFPDTFSGGMQRRLTVARALVHQPQVLFLDEPTTGLDPQSRRAVWDYIGALRSQMTIFLTTHYLDEADTLCDRIVIMDHGKILVDGTAAELKERLAHAHGYELNFRGGGDRYAVILNELPFITSQTRHGDTFLVTLAEESNVKQLLDAVGNEDLKGVCLREPSLEDVFISLTGREVRE